MTHTVVFESGGTRCVATLRRPPYTGRPVPCVVMGHGFSGTQDQLVPYAEAFAAAGLAVLTFDYRGFGRSGGHPRQVINLRRQREDWRAAVRLARSMDGIDPGRVALWGSSLSASHVLTLGVEDPTLAALVVQVPAFDKSLRTMSRELRTKLRAGAHLGPLLRTSGKASAAALYDGLRGVLGASPHYIPVFGRPGETAAFAVDDLDERLPEFARTGITWRNEFAPRFMFGRPTYTPGTAERVRMPFLVCVAERDTEADPALAGEVARTAPRGELRSYPYEHFEVYFEPALHALIRDQLEFLRRTLLTAAVHR